MAANFALTPTLSLMATNSWNGKVEGINSVQASEVAKYGAGDYRPVLPITYWTFRLMIGFGLIAAAVAALGLWVTRRRRLPTSKWTGTPLNFGTYPMVNGRGRLERHHHRRPAVKRSPATPALS